MGPEHKDYEMNIENSKAHVDLEDFRQRIQPKFLSLEQSNWQQQHFYSGIPENHHIFLIKEKACFSSTPPNLLQLGLVCYFCSGYMAGRFIVSD